LKNKKTKQRRPTTATLPPRRPRPGRPTAVGVMSGIGSLLVAARLEGFKVLGSVEDRSTFRYRDAEGRNTFEENFPRTFYVKTVDESPIDDLAPVTLVVGMPSCGNFSGLRACISKKYQDPKKIAAARCGCSEIPVFIEGVKRARPDYFFMDNLPGSLDAVPAKEWHENLSQYDLFFEWVNNYGYGNPQKHRKRLFVIGARKNLGYTFVPNERDIEPTVADKIGDILGREGCLPNHDEHSLAAKYYYWHTYRQFRRHMKKLKEGTHLHQVSKEGHTFIGFGESKARWHGHTSVLVGSSIQWHPKTNLPLSLRERLRLMGFPDDFVLYGTRFNPKDGGWDHYKNRHLISQTGQCIPIEACRHVAGTMMTHRKGKTKRWSGRRLVRRNATIDRAKLWYCRNVGYSKQTAACANCWIAECPMNTPGAPIEMELKYRERVAAEDFS